MIFYIHIDGNMMIVPLYCKIGLISVVKNKNQTICTSLLIKFVIASVHLLIMFKD